MEEYDLVGDKMPADLTYQYTRLMFNFNVLEAHLYHAFARMIGDDSGAETEAILSGVDSISYKLGVIEGVAGVRAETNTVAKCLVELGPEIRQLVTYRNKVAHSLLGVGSTGEYHLVQNVLRIKKGKFRADPLRVRELASHAALATRIGERLLAACGGLSPITLRQDQAQPVSLRRIPKPTS